MTDEECSSLHIYQGDDGTCISMLENFDLGQGKVLFHGKIWLGILWKTQPQVWVDCTNTVL
jgi:hypothetical protein